MSSQTKLPRLAVTLGEPAGVGADIILQISQQSFACELVVLGAKELLLTRAKLLNLPIELIDFNEHTPMPHRPGFLSVIDYSLRATVVPGKLNVHNAAYVIEILTAAAQGCLEKKFDAVVTAPVHKGIINLAGIKFSGHTEFFAELAGVDQVVMMLTTPNMRVALATTHLPLAQVAAAITPAHLEKCIRILHAELQIKFNKKDPIIYVAGLNPHAGENGQLGTEEIEIIIPVLEMLRREQMKLIGPLPADTLYLAKNMSAADAFLAMYHDQGLPVIKFDNFAEAVNVTLGLPFIRTSVDHGTALELAGSGLADSRSLLAAINMAINFID